MHCKIANFQDWAFNNKSKCSNKHIMTMIRLWTCNTRNLQRPLSVHVGNLHQVFADLQVDPGSLYVHCVQLTRLIEKYLNLMTSEINRVNHLFKINIHAYANFIEDTNTNSIVFERWRCHTCTDRCTHAWWLWWKHRSVTIWAAPRKKGP